MKYLGVLKVKIYEVLVCLIDKGMVMDFVLEKKKLYIVLLLKLVIEKLMIEF